MAGLPFVVAADVEGEERIPKRVSKLLLAPKNVGTRSVSMGLNVTAVGSMIPDHTHEDSEEVMFIISGQAKLVIEGEGEWESGCRQCERVTWGTAVDPQDGAKWTVAR